MGKKNGKTRTRKPRKAPAKVEEEILELEEFPVGRFELTKEKALEWMAKEYPGWHELLNSCQEEATKEEKSAVGYLQLELGYMVEACVKVVQNGKPVQVVGFEKPTKERRPSSWEIQGPMRVLRASVRLEGDALVAGAEARETLASALGEFVDAVADAERARDHEELESRIKAREPNGLSEKYEKRIKAVEAERDEACSHVSTPWDKGIAALNWEWEKLCHDTWAYKDPGPPPEGYRPSELAR